MEKSFIGEKFQSLGENRFNRTIICHCLREDFKKAFGKPWKFSVRKTSGSGIQIEIKQMPKKELNQAFEKWTNFIHPENFNNSATFNKLEELGHAYNYDRSDAQTDYFDCNYYLTWDVSNIKYI